MRKREGKRGNSGRISHRLNIMLYSPDSRDVRGREGSLSVYKGGSMKGRTDEKMSVLTGLAAHGDTQLHTWQRRAFICG